MSVVQSFGQGGCVEINAAGMVNATRLCQTGGKSWSAYARTDTTEAFIRTLAAALQKSRAELIIQNVSGNVFERHTWVHQRIAINLANWISPEFAVWVTDIVHRYLHGELEPPAPQTLVSITGNKEWSVAQFYISQILGDSWDSLKFCDGGDRAMLPADRVRLFVLKFGHQDTGSRQTTHIREFGGDYKLLDSFPTPFNATVESRVRNWLRARGMLMEGKHSKRDGKDTELCGVASIEEYATVVDAVRKIIAEVETEMRQSLQMCDDEPLELRLERVRQQGETQRYRIEQEQKTARHAQRQQTKRMKLTGARSSSPVASSPVASSPVASSPVASRTRGQSTTILQPTLQASQAPQLSPSTPSPSPQFDQDTVTFQTLVDSRSPQSIVQMKGGDVIYRHPSLKHVVGAGFCKPSVSSVLHNSKHTHAGFEWVYGPPTDEMLKTVTVPFSRTGAVVQSTPAGEFVNSYRSALRASSAVGVTGTTIVTAIREKKICHLHRWTMRKL